MVATVICPYIHEHEVQHTKNKLRWDIPSIFKKDTALIGSDLMYQTLWNECDTDIIILHSDMFPLPEDENSNWYDELCKYANQYPEAGIIGCKLLYPATNEKQQYFVQSGGGYFDDDNMPQHYGSGLILETGGVFKTLEPDIGQYDKIREVAWITFGGIYIRREVLNQVGNFDPNFEWSYNRDVDYCLQVRNLGWKIYVTPTTLLHYESKDNKQLRQQNTELNFKESRNLDLLKNKWKNSKLLKTINKEID